MTVGGGGYIGLEAAAVLNSLGKSVVVLEAADRVLARVAGEELSSFYQAEHRSRGVDVRTDVELAGPDFDNGRAVAAQLRGGERIATDMVIVGIGMVPETAPLTAAGVRGSNGVDVDEYCRTTLLDVYAIEDCAAHVSKFADGARIRLESVQNANDQAKTVAAHIAGEPTPYAEIPWFWSHQYDLKLQTVGLSAGHDQTIVRGASRRFSVLYLKERRLVALDCVNSIKDYVQGRVHVMSGAVLDQAQLASSEIALKHVAEQTSGSPV
ncbi:NAD(P)/FAD-dependent oxidoreductase [Amycolatopsis sp. NPDC049868]|uniref:NAD(P)/FAD-dependent oxidoreductase n=1 Tax=Amycolatopsis sp. NPDC049868 TaxID=3363934 RepID=UPI0037A27682